MPYHAAGTAWSPRRVLLEGTAHCLEGAIFAAAALRVLGFPPLLLDLEAVQDTDHVLAVFRLRGSWGAIAKCNFSGLRYREPVYRSVRELVMSYFEGYINLRGERTLRANSRPVNLAAFDRRRPGWMISESDLWWIPEYLLEWTDARSKLPSWAIARTEFTRSGDGFGGGVDRPLRIFVRQGRASSTRLKGVSAARRNRVKPASVATFFKRASPAWAPSAVPTSCDREFGVQSIVDAA